MSIGYLNMFGTLGNLKIKGIFQVHPGPLNILLPLGKIQLPRIGLITNIRPLGTTLLPRSNDLCILIKLKT